MTNDKRGQGNHRPPTRSLTIGHWSFSIGHFPLLCEPLRHRHPPADSEGAAGDLQAGDGLGSLVFVEVHAPGDPAHGFFLPAAGDDLGDAELLLDVELKDRVKNFVGRQSVLI